MEMTKETLTFYTPYSDVSKIMEALKKVFHLKIKNLQHKNNNLDVYLMDNEEIHVSYATKIGYALALEDQIQKFYKFVEEINCGNDTIKANLLTQVLLFQGIYRVEFEYYPDERNEKIVSLMEVADNLTALILWEMGDISNSYGDIILSSDGECEVAMFNPVDEFSLQMQKFDLSEEQIQRMYRTAQILRYKGIYSPNNLDVPDSSRYFMYLDHEDIAKRAIANMILAIYAGLLVVQKWDSLKAFEYINQIIQMYNAAPFFSTKEIEFLNTGHPSDEECFLYYQAFEYCNVMLWAMGIIEKLYYPSAKCNESIIVQKILSFISVEEMVNNSKLKSVTTFMDELDLVRKYESACKFALQHHFEVPAQLDYKVIQYRHKALKYLVSDQEASWDNVETNLIYMEFSQAL